MLSQLGAPEKEALLKGKVAVEMNDLYVNKFQIRAMGAILIWDCASARQKRFDSFGGGFDSGQPSGFESGPKSAFDSPWASS